RYTVPIQRDKRRDIVAKSRPHSVCCLQTRRNIAGSLLGRRLAGYTLLETLIALVILGFSLAGLTMLMIGNFETAREGRRFTTASALAQKKIEEFRALGYAGATVGTGTDSVTETGATTGLTMYSRSWAVTAPVAPAGIKDVTMAVSWI